MPYDSLITFTFYIVAYIIIFRSVLTRMVDFSGNTAQKELVHIKWAYLAVFVWQPRPSVCMRWWISTNSYCVQSRKTYLPHPIQCIWHGPASCLFHSERWYSSRTSGRFNQNIRINILINSQLKLMFNIFVWENVQSK